MKKFSAFIFISTFLITQTFAQSPESSALDYFGFSNPTVKQFILSNISPSTIAKLRQFGATTLQKITGNNASPSSVTAIPNSLTNQPLGTQPAQSNSPTSILGDLVSKAGFGSLGNMLGGNRNGQQQQNITPPPSYTPPLQQPPATPDPEGDKKRREELEQKTKEIKDALEKCLKDAGTDQTKIDACNNKKKEDEKKLDEENGNGGKFTDLLNGKCDYLADKDGKSLATAKDYFLAKIQNLRTKKEFYLAYKKSFLNKTIKDLSYGIYDAYTVPISEIRNNMIGKCYVSNLIQASGEVMYCCKGANCSNKSDLNGKLFTATGEIPQSSFGDCK